MLIKDKLKLLTDADTVPALGDGELDELLAGAAVADAAGLAPLHEEWTPTYDINSAAAQGWLIKAARAAATVETDDAGTATSLVFHNCLRMARMYTAKRAVSCQVSVVSSER